MATAQRSKRRKATTRGTKPPATWFDQRDLLRAADCSVWGKPSLWGRFTVRSDINLPQRHEVIQIVMGRYGEHLRQLIIGDTTYQPNNPNFGRLFDLDDDDEQEAQHVLRHVVRNSKERFRYQ